MSTCINCKYKDYNKMFYYQYCHNFYNFETRFNFKNNASYTEYNKHEAYFDYYLYKVDKVRFKNLLLFKEYFLEKLRYPDSKLFDDEYIKEFILKLLPSRLKEKKCFLEYSYFLYKLIDNRNIGIQIEQDLDMERYIIHSFEPEVCISFLIDFLYNTLGNPKHLHEVNFKMKKIERIIVSKYKDDYAKYKENTSEQKNREGHKFLRNLMIEEFGRCFFTNIDNPALLEISHCKPFAVCNGIEAINPNNVLLLEFRYSKLFDRGFIAFDDLGNINFSQNLSNSTLEVINDDRFKSLNIPITEDLKYFLQWHRDNIFQH